MRQEVGRDVGDVVAVIGRLGPFGVARLEAARARLHRGGQGGDLDAGVVVVELARHFDALRLEQRRQRIAQRGLAAVADMQRTGRVGRDEFDDRMVAAGAAGAAEGFTLLEHVAHHRLLGGGGHAQVDEAGAGDVRRFDQALRARLGLQRGDQAGGQFARIGLERLGQLHGDIAGDVAVRGIARTLQHHIGHEVGAGDDRGEGCLEQGNDLLFLLGEHGMVEKSRCWTAPVLGRMSRQTADIILV